MNTLTQKAIRLIDDKIGQSANFLVAIDGRCASGKTTMAEQLRQHYGCNVIHMDHFFLRPEQRTPQRLAEPGENVDHERFLEQVLLPLRMGQEVSYQPFDCQIQALREPVQVSPNTITIVEGTYCCHPKLWEHYDLRLFLTVEEGEQLRRIRLRNGETMAKMFRDRWIPLEERYFRAYPPEGRFDLCLGND